MLDYTLICLHLQESKPEDPARYVYQKLGESLEKGSTKNNVKPSNGPLPVSSEAPDKDATMTDVPPTQPSPIVTQQTEASHTPVAAVSTSSPVTNVASQPTYHANATESIEEVKQEPNVKPDTVMPSASTVNPTPPADSAQAPVAEGNGTKNATTASIPATNSASVQ